MLPRNTGSNNVFYPPGTFSPTSDPFSLLTGSDPASPLECLENLDPSLQLSIFDGPTVFADCPSPIISSRQQQQQQQQQQQPPPPLPPQPKQGPSMTDNSSSSNQVSTNQNGGSSEGGADKCLQSISDLSAEVQALLAKAREAKNFFTEEISQDMPGGCVIHLHKRPSTSAKKTYDKYWFSPKTGKRMRSTVEVNKFLHHLKTADGDEVIAFAILKGRKKPAERGKAVPKESVVKAGTPRRRKPSALAKEAASAAVQSSPASTKKGNAKKRKAQPVAGTKKTNKKRTKTSQEHVIEYNIEAAKVSGQIGVDGKEKESFIAESKTLTTPRRKKVAAKKASSANPFQANPSTHSALPQVAESK